jgi:hypothetical protein
MGFITSDELKKVPYLDLGALGERTVKLMPLWDGANWRMWLDTPIGIIEGKILDTSEGDYVAKSPAKPSDLFIPFVHLMWQQASYREVAPMIVGISEDFHNMGTSVAKLKHFCEFRSHIRAGATRRFASTELEYLVTLARTVFDLLHEIIVSIWRNRVHLLDERAEAFRKSHPLPKTFSKMVLNEKVATRTADEIEAQFGLPKPLAEQYARSAPFFFNLRSIRDRVIHGGSGFGTVFETERGFCVDPRVQPFSSYRGWRPQHYYNENIVSVLPWVADTILNTIDACNSLMVSFSQIVTLPPPIAPEYLVFVRGPHNEALAELLSINSGASPWWEERVTA